MMVMSTEQEEQFGSEPDIADAGSENTEQETTETTPTDATTTESGELIGPDVVAPTGQAAPTEQAASAPAEAPAPPFPSIPEDAQKQIKELHQMREANAQKEWEAQTLRKARALEQRAQEQGADPQSSRQIARQYLSHQRDIKDRDRKAGELLSFQEGRQNAALHFAQKHKLLNRQAVDDLAALARARSPQEMEQEAKRISHIRAQDAEISRLKQGQVAPQTFDNSQGSAEATSNSSRLLDDYNDGVRSEAAMAAARKLTLGR
jgi:hypothetical protein